MSGIDDRGEYKGLDDEPPVFDSLHIPPPVLERGGVEVLRAVIVDGELHVSLRRAFDDPDPWGMLLADVTRHIARLYATEGALTQDQVVERVRATYDSEMAAPGDTGSGSVIG
ncbi:MAG: DUF5076 domain-containing protein [Hyphomicrobiales bacterium]|nr:DUF5076 domain-containing protein [Hyphomicrobiales bacterium]